MKQIDDQIFRNKLGKRGFLLFAQRIGNGYIVEHTTEKITRFIKRTINETICIPVKWKTEESLKKRKKA